jgi:orotidine-5'-phosphate decarboxylase
MSFRDKLASACKTNGSLLCIGLDPDPRRLPIDDPARFLCGIIEATSDLVCAYKPNLAFYEQLGEAGYTALRAVLQTIPDGTPVIADAKRGDIPRTAAAYAAALFDELGFDAATVNAYLGGDAVAPFAAYAERGVFIVCRSSNPGARDLQDLPVPGPRGQRPLYQAVAELALGWNVHGNVGLVAGATYPEELRALRALCPDLPFLVPGVGAQEGNLERAVRSGLDDRGAGLIINASRSVLYASGGPDYAEAARTEARALRDAIERHRLAARAGSPV